MRVDGRDVAVSGSLLQPLTRRTNDILRLALAGAVPRRRRHQLADHPQRVGGAGAVDLARSSACSAPTQSNTVYLIYGVAILALPFVILIGLIVAAAVEAARRVRRGGADRDPGAVDHRQRHRRPALALRPRASACDTVLSQFLDDPRWIAMLAAVLTVSGPWLPARWRRWWWALLLAFVPIHLVVSAVVPARSLLGLAVGWFVGALVGARRRDARAGGAARRRGARDGPPRFPGHDAEGGAPGRAGSAGAARDRAGVRRRRPNRATAIVELYGPHQRSGGFLRQFWRQAAAARQRDRTAADLDAPRGRTPRADGASPSATSGWPTPPRSRWRRWTAAGRCTRTNPPGASPLERPAPTRPRSPGVGLARRAAQPADLAR